MEQEIRFCNASDNTRLAFAKVGEGPPVVKVANWLSHLEYDWNSPVWKPWLEQWSRYHTLYRYDQRGCGLSDWDVDDFTMDALLGDLETVVDASDLEHFDLFGMSQGGSIAIRYAARHPERVNRLIIYGGYVRGQLRRDPTPEKREAVKVELELIKLGWGTENPAYRQVYSTLLIPEGTLEQFTWFNQLQLVSTSPQNAVELQKSFNQVDIQKLARTIQVPTLVLHAEKDANVPFDEGRITAAYIPDARFIPLASKNHILLKTEPAWMHFWDEYYHFLGIDIKASAAREEKVTTPVRDSILLELSPRERDILRLVAEGYQNTEIARKLVLSEKTVRNYISNVYTKLQINSRGEAIVLARKNGLVNDKG